MFSGVTSSARSPSQTKMMTLRAAAPPGCGAAGPPPSPSTTHDKAIKKMNLLIFMVVLVSEFEGGPRGARHRPDDLEPLRTASRVVAFQARGNHAATDVFWLSTVAIFCQPSILRNLIWPVATRLKSSTTAASSLGS